MTSQPGAEDSKVELKTIKFKESELFSLFTFADGGPSGRLFLETQNLVYNRKFLEALKQLEPLITNESTQVMGLCFRAFIMKQIGDRALAMTAYEEALKLDPKNWIAHNNQGVHFAQERNFEASVNSFRLATKLAPMEENVAKENIAIVLTELATNLKLSGNNIEAKEKYLEAISYHPKHAAAYYNLGVLCGEVERTSEEAIKNYELAIKWNPDYPEAIGNLGVIYKNQGKLDKAIKLYERALSIKPQFPVCQKNLAIAYTDLGTKIKVGGDFKTGLAYYHKALQVFPQYASAWYNIGVVHAESSRFDDAILAYEQCIVCDPKCVEAYNNVGVIYKDKKGNIEKAIYYYKKGLEANPDYSLTLNNLAGIWSDQGKSDEAEILGLKAVKCNPTYAEAWNNLGIVYRDQGRIRKALEFYGQCITVDPYNRNANSNRLFAMNSLIPRKGETDKQISDFVYDQHRAWGDHFMKLYHPLTSWDVTLETKRPLRIGYLSGDFFTHSVSYFIEAPLKFADRKMVTNVCYSNVGRGDLRTTYFQSLAHEWRNVAGVSHLQAAEMIRADKIDILVELTGHTSGNRLDIAAMRPAPLQITWIGYPNTTGLPTIDYRFTDPIVDVPETKQKHREELKRLPGCFLCYTPPTDLPELVDPPVTRNDFITFASFNNLGKFNRHVIRCWCMIMKDVKDSILVLKCKPFASTPVRERLYAKFAKHGIPKTRLRLELLRPSTGSHLQTYNEIDLALDTFPYAGTTTTCEALAMSVPVVTLTKAHHHSHSVGHTLLSRVKGLEDLIAFTEEDYIKKAIALANDRPRLLSLRKEIRERLKASSLCDGKTFTKGLEDTYHEIWNIYVDKQKSKS